MLENCLSPVNLRSCRYRGLEKTRLQHIAAINLERISACLEGIPLVQTRQSPA